MAIKPRIHWAADGTSVWQWTSGYIQGAAISQDKKYTLDGDNLIISDLYDWDNFGPMFQFPDNIQIHSVKIRSYDAFACNAWVSSVATPNDWNPVDDPQWTQVITNANYTPAYSYIEFGFSSIIDCKWLLMNVQGARTYCIHFFGEYTAPRLEFWNVGETAELNTAQLPLVMPNAPNTFDYHEYLAFKIKNTASDMLTHSYSLTVSKVKYTADPPITSYWTLGKSPLYGKSQTIQVLNVPYNDFSEEIRVFGDVLIANNPADQIHYFVVDVTEQ